LFTDRITAMIAETAAAPYPAAGAEEVANSLVAVASLDDLPPAALAGISSPMPIDDVLTDVESFGRQYAAARAHDFPMPCVVTADGSVLPLDNRALFLLAGRARSPDQVDAGLRLLEDASPTVAAGEELALVGADEAQGWFRRRLAGFLERRLSEPTRHGEVNDPFIPPGYVEFTVAAARPSLRVLYHPLYWRDVETVFGQPTTPLTRFIKPGKYIFGVEGLDLPLTYDPRVIEIPPQSDTMVMVALP
jgi:hypothetical protein